MNLESIRSAMKSRLDILRENPRTAELPRTSRVGPSGPFRSDSGTGRNRYPSCPEGTGHTPSAGVSPLVAAPDAHAETPGGTLAMFKLID